MAITTPQRPGTQPARGAIPLIHDTLPRRAPWLVLGGSMLAGYGLSLLLVGGNLVAAALLAAVVHTLTLGAWSRHVEGPRRATDRVVTSVVTSAFVVAMTPLVSVVLTVVTNGITRFDVEFFTFSMRGVVGEGGGAYHAILGTLIITGLATLMSVPIGLMAAVYLVEYAGRGRLGRAITFFVDVMTGIPSIVAGLFAYAMFAVFFGPGVRMGIAGAVALTVLMIPVVVRSTEEMLKLVPNRLREASLALGVPKWRTVVKVVLPTSAAGIATGVTLAVARVIGETAPLLITVGITTGTNLNPFDGRMATLPVFAYYSYVSPGVPRDPYTDRAWTAALVLIIIVMVLNLAARLISRLFSPKTGR